MKNPLIQLRNRHLRGEIGGMFAVCSAQRLVLEAAMDLARDGDGVLLIEATANQVNQAGGYTGMAPGDFATCLRELARDAGFPFERIVIGADHLGPHVWKDEPAAAAMHKAAELARRCVRAGFKKIHLDSGAGCVDDPGDGLPVETVARRAAELCAAAEAAAGDRGEEDRPLYVIGNEVPLPGGGLEDLRRLQPTVFTNLTAALEAYEYAFGRAGLASAWQRVVAVVVQPGVDFGDRIIAPYRPACAAALSAGHARLPGCMTYEIHATDYQSPPALRHMVRDHFPLLKVGPSLTFALRAIVFALAHIEQELPGLSDRSDLLQVMEDLMTRYPAHWHNHYRGTPEELRFFAPLQLPGPHPLLLAPTGSIPRPGPPDPKSESPDPQTAPGSIYTRPCPPVSKGRRRREPAGHHPPAHPQGPRALCPRLPAAGVKPAG